MILKNRSNALIIFNPKSGKQDPGSIDIIKKVARDLGWEGDFIKTTSKNMAKVLTQNAIKNEKTHVIVCGGDGTVREVLSQTVKNKITVGIVPLGTGNIFAKNLNIPLDLEESVKVAFNGRTKSVDIGEANGNYFILIAGVGLDVDAMSAEPDIKSKFGTIAYILEGLKNLSKKPENYQVTIDNTLKMSVEAKSIMVANIGTTEAGIKIVPGAKPQSGYLKIGIIKTSGLMSWAELIASALKGEIDKSNSYELYEGYKIEIIPISGPKPFECDGDVFPAVSNLKIEIFPQSVSVLVPNFSSE
jgi:YegS/Rv2252/BmrU family lipid kinase